MTRAELIAALDAVGCRENDELFIELRGDVSGVEYKITNVNMVLRYDVDYEDTVITIDKIED